MNEPIQEPIKEETLGNFDSRKKLTEQWKKHWGDMLSAARNKGQHISQWVQNQSPLAEIEGEPINAIFSMTERLGVRLEDDQENGIPSTNLEEILSDPVKAAAFQVGTETKILNRFKGYSRKEHNRNLEQLAYSLDDVDPGSSFRPYSDSEMRDGELIREWPPTSAVFASVTAGAADMRTVEYIPSKAGEKPQEWDGVSDIPLGILKEAETPVSSQWYAGGVKMSQFSLNNATMAQSIALRRQKWETNLSNMMTTDGLKGIQARKTDFDADLEVVTATGGYKLDLLIDIATCFHAERHAYEITTLIMNLPELKRYVKAAATIARDEGGPEPTQGGLIGSDRYGRVGMRRMFYDLPETDINFAANNILGFDASDTIDLFIVLGTVTTADEMIARNRSREISWTIRWGVAPRIEKGTSPVKLFK